MYIHESSLFSLALGMQMNCTVFYFVLTGKNIKNINLRGVRECIDFILLSHMVCDFFVVVVGCSAVSYEHIFKKSHQI